jgi:hypothetical protein
MNEEEKNAIEYYQNKEVSFSADFDTEKLLKALGITEEDSFQNHQIRFKTLLNLIEKLQKENEELEISNKYTIHLTDKQYNAVIENAQNDINQKWIQKVKDKIEEILNNKEYRIVFEGNAEFPDDATIINAQKYIKLEKMQELIEEREEN